MSDDEGLFTAPWGGAFPTAAPSEFVDFGWQDVSCSGWLMRAWISRRLPLLLLSLPLSPPSLLLPPLPHVGPLSRCAVCREGR